ncbi:unnamed protein product [Boreogadus saida]
MYGVHRTTIHRKMQQNGLSVSDMYSEMSDTQLDALVLEIHRIHLCGYRMLRYHLQGRGHLVQIHRCFPATRILTHLRSCLFSDPCLSDYPACSLIPACLTILPAAQPLSACLLLCPRLLIHQPASPAFDPSPA